MFFSLVKRQSKIITGCWNIYALASQSVCSQSVVQNYKFASFNTRFPGNCLTLFYFTDLKMLLERTHVFLLIHKVIFRSFS